MSTMKRNNLAVGDVFAVGTGMLVRTKIPARYVYHNHLGTELLTATVKVGTPEVLKVLDKSGDTIQDCLNSRGMEAAESAVDTIGSSIRITVNVNEIYNVVMAAINSLPTFEAEFNTDYLQGEYVVTNVNSSTGQYGMGTDITITAKKLLGGNYNSEGVEISFVELDRPTIPVIKKMKPAFI